MKKLYNLFVLIFCIAIYGQNGNFVSSRVFLDSTKTLNSTTKQVYTIQYFDGLGRLKQSIGVKSSPNSKDIVTQVEYDPFSRISKEFLPLPQNSTQSGMMYSNVDESIGSVLYDDTLLYSENEIENSPIAKILHYGNPGHSWGLNSGHSISYNYKANETIDDVKKYNGNSTWTVANTDIYTTNNGVPPVEKFAVNTLYKNVIADEDGNESIDFKNKLGKTVLIRKILNAEETADTYYIYNQYNQLVFVIPPLASVKSELSQTDLDQLCYQYRYDNQNRLVEKKLPGKGWEYMVYDQQDRLVITQDAMLRTTTNNFAKRGWLFTKYDQFGRVAYTGFFANTATRETMQKSLNSMSSNAANKETRDDIGFVQNGLTVYYTKTAFPTGSMTILSVNYYDKYPADLTNIPTTIQGETILTVTSQTTNKINTKSLPLASFVKNIDNDSWTKNYTFYDLKARAIGTHSYNYLGGYTKTESKLDFSGVATETYTYHKRLSSDTDVTIKERFEYDAQNRLIKHWHNVNNASNDELLTFNEYNELGQLKNKKVGGTTTPLQTVDYSYNVRGWMTQVNNPTALGTDLFGYKMKYNNPANTTLAPAKYNGNISEIDWKTSKDNNLRRYGYIYDNLNRLNIASYQKPEASVPETHSYDESIYYDLNGNILTLQRNGTTDGVAGTQIDDLEYYYTGNQLTKVVDVSANYDGYPDTSGNIISYDANGNMTSLLDKEIKTISYNFLNLPNKITFTGVIGRTTTNINTVNSYRADGVKIKKAHQSPNLSGSIVTKTTDYLDGFQYETVNTEATALQFVPTSEGYFDFVKNLYIYNYVDHLGNVRLSYADSNKNGVIDPSTEIIEENNYYPFGLKHEGYNSLAGNPKYQYKYNGKELQESGMYDYGARFYMPDIGRWGVHDPKSELLESSSPYVYALNSPVLYLDKDGELPILINGRVGSDDERGKSIYWSKEVINTIRGSGIPNPHSNANDEFHFVDGDRYLMQDFSGNWKMHNASFLWGNSTRWRYEAGKSAMTDAEFQTILSKLAKDPKTGKIIEKIQIYTHSRGAAFGQGYTERLVEMIKENSDLFADAANEVEFSFNMAPNESWDTSAVGGVPTYTMDHKKDWLSGNRMEGVKGAFTSNEGGGGVVPGAHKNDSFKKDLKAFIGAFLKGGSSQNVIDNFVKTMKKEYGITVTVKN